MIRVLVRCDGVALPRDLAGEEWDRTEEIRHRGASANLNLSIQAPRADFNSLTGRAADLLAIAAYAFGADQQVRRGGLADAYGDDWRRSFTLVVPVSDPRFWSTPDVSSRLTATLLFASEDRWTFRFVPARRLEEHAIPLGVDANELLREPDVVCLLSGGLDSLCSVVDQFALRKRKPLLVGHSPAFHIGARQRALRNSLKEHFHGWHFPYVSGAVHRMGSDAPETSQRTRSFLYATLGAVVASALRLHDVQLADNGVVSLNLPLNDQVIGAMATRSTHPKFLRLFNALLQVVFPGGPQVSNPLWNHTRREALGLLQEADAVPLLEGTNSCAHPHGRPAMQPFCGVCSQCVDRRFATIAAGLDEYDPADRYALDIFHDSIPDERTARLMVFSYYRHCRELTELVDDEFFSRFPQLGDCVDPAADDQVTVATSLVAMLRRHGETNVRVMDEMIKAASGRLARGTLPLDCLVTLAAAQGAPTATAEPSAVFRPSPDYRVITFRGEEYQATVNQARVIQLMHEQKDAGNPVLSQDFILERLDIGSKTLLQVFRGSRLWKTIIVATGRGLYQLNF